MASFYILLKVIALLAVIIIPLSGPKRKKAATETGMSKLAVNEGGYLEHFVGIPEDHHPVQ
nr:hypothetical protein [Mucilaginibacter sp. SP1R1]MBB6149349.1 hypothetical protein [Mucilaginibacter sp. SP1R1]